MKIVSLVIGLSICIGSAQGQWQPAGFLGSNTTCIAQHPQDTSTVLVAVSDSLFHSSDGGHSWSFLVHFNGLPINLIMYDPMYCDTVYALLGCGTFSDGIYRSTDGGYNWAVLEWMLYPRCMTIPGQPPLLMLVGCDSIGIIKTEDGGSSWTPWNDGLTDIHIYSLAFCNPSDTFPIFYAGTAHGLFYKSFNGWIQANGVPVDLRVSLISYHPSEEIGFASVTGGSWSDGIYRSTDYGYNWQVVDWWIYPSCVVLNPLWQNYPNDTCGVFAGDSGLGTKYSTNCGTTWQEVNSGLGNTYVNSLSYHPQDSMRLFAATQGGLYRYQYSPGVKESEVDKLEFFSIRLNVIQRTGLPILFECLMDDNAGVRQYRVRMYDAAGRLERALRLDDTSAILAPIQESGVYFLLVDRQNKLHKKKIIVID